MRGRPAFSPVLLPVLLLTGLLTFLAGPSGAAVDHAVTAGPPGASLSGIAPNGEHAVRHAAVTTVHPAPLPLAALPGDPVEPIVAQLGVRAEETDGEQRGGALGSPQVRGPPAPPIS